MDNEKTYKKTEVAQFLNEALMIFCEEDKDLRPSLAVPFRQQDCVLASDGCFLIRIKTKEAGVGIGAFRKMDDFDAQAPIPFIGFHELLTSWTVRRVDMVQVLDQMKKYEDETRQPVVADMCGIMLTMKGLSQIEKAMAILGAEQGRLVWHQDNKVVIQLDNGKKRDAITILRLGSSAEKKHVIALPLSIYRDGTDVSIDWLRGMRAWADIKAEMERKAETERMARRAVYMVNVVRSGFIPVYARNADEALSLCSAHLNCLDPEDDDGCWMLGDTVPEAVDMDDMDDCYESFITRDGVVERDDICQLDQLSEEWHKGAS